jgi:hypothetical protein
VKRPEGKTDEEILAEVEKKVVQIIGNYTHKEWECAQKILKHSGRVNSALEEMNVSCPPHLRLLTVGKKMQHCVCAGGNFVKGKAGKIALTTEGTSKSAKARDVLAQRKAEAAKTTLPPLAEKSSKLMKI